MNITTHAQLSGPSRSPALRIILAGLLTLSSVAAAHPYFDCDIDLGNLPKVSSWNDLPGEDESNLTEPFIQILDQNRFTRVVASRYAKGRNLCFDLRKTGLGKGGWGIQTRFLRLVLDHVFPFAEWDSPGPAGCLRVPFTLYDSVMEAPKMASDLDILSLKAVNPGPDLPNVDQIRRMMNLPIKSRIVSLYASRTHENEAPEIAERLMRGGAADLVILSTQSGMSPLALQIDALARAGITYVPSTIWAGLDRRPARSALIFNTTRQRMPWVHRAADVAVVLGMANVVEPLHAGKPSFLIGIAPADYDQKRWSEVIKEAGLTGGAHVIDALENLPNLILSHQHLGPRVTLFENTRLVGRLMRKITRVIDDHAAGREYIPR